MRGNGSVVMVGGCGVYIGMVLLMCVPVWCPSIYPYMHVSMYMHSSCLSCSVTTVTIVTLECPAGVPAAGLLHRLLLQPLCAPYTHPGCCYISCCCISCCSAPTDTGALHPLLLFLLLQPRAAPDDGVCCHALVPRP
jgi:hypothetical protein